VDGDGDTDLVLGSTGTQSFWLENQAGNASAWLLRTLITSLGEPLLSVADLDRDGDLDVVGTGTSVPGWFENTAGNGSVWTRRPIGTVNFPFRGAAFDVDSDRRPGRARVHGHRHALVRERGRERLGLDHALLRSRRAGRHDP
jgi:hypothetical protein